MMTVQEFIRWYIDHWEGKLSMNPKDHGNYFKGKLVGSQYGVTGQAYSAWSGLKDITEETIKSITKDDAVKIGEQLFYLQPRINWLPWNAVSASLIDKCWGSGNIHAVKILQEMLRLPQDGFIGKNTVHAFTTYVAEKGEEQTARDFAKYRIAYDKSLHQSTFTDGWINRTNSFLPGTPFWKEFYND